MDTSIVEIITTLIKALVDEPDQVNVTEVKNKNSPVVFEATVAKKDMGKVIGRNGRTIDSLRTIIGACGAKREQQCIFQLIDDEEEN